MKSIAKGVLLPAVSALLSLMLPGAALAQTALKITATGAGMVGTVTVVVQLPSSSSLGGPTNVSGLVVSDAMGNNIPITPSPGYTPAGTQGYFSFYPKASTTRKHQLAATAATPLPLTIKATNANQTLDSAAFTFNDSSIGIPKECPCGAFTAAPFNPICNSAQHPQYPGDPTLSASGKLSNGSNFFEVVLNVASPNGESADISCVQGANSIISGSFQPLNGNWTDGTNANVTSIQNSWVQVHANGMSGLDANCNLSGVYAYGLTNCTTALSTGNALGACPNYPAPIRKAFCTDNSGPALGNCLLSRAAGVSGGTVTITYMGETNPPGLH